MPYIIYNLALNEADASGMTATALKQAGITAVTGFGGKSIPVNSEGFLVNPAQYLPDGMLDKLKAAWSSSNGDTSKFFEQSIDGASVKSILSQCPSQQSYGIAKELRLPDGTNVPCKEFTASDYTSIKYNSGSSSNGGSASDGAGAAPDAGSAAPAPEVGANDGAGAGSGDWWSFFGSKEFLIGAVALGGIIAIVKSLGNTIKARFRKCAKVLYDMQKDFGTKKDGMDMKAILPGVGSRIMDWVGKLFGGKSGEGKNRGALGLRPFVDNYRNEISADLAESKKAFNLIRGAADSQASGEMDNHIESHPNESVNETSKKYESFAEALAEGPLNETKDNTLNEIALGTAIAAGSLALSGIKLAAGAFKFSTTDKHGKEEEKEVKVTPKSVREICYSILNVFYGKYFDLEKAFKTLGINDLGDVDKSNVDKFAKVVKKSSEEIPAGGKSRMFARVEKNYDMMVNSYIRIGNTVVNNFEKYTKERRGLNGKERTLSEKDSNLLVAATEKLKSELKRQEDGYKNNFARVMNAIISSPEYAEFTTFIIDDVLPVFKSGLASDADYVLDTFPKVGEYYIVRQTSGQPGLEQDDTAKGNTVLVRIKEFVQNGDVTTPKVTFTRVALLTDPGQLNRTEKMEYDMSGYKEKNLDRTAFGKARGINADVSGQQGDAVTLDYDKWLALDPTLAINVPGDDRDISDLLTTKLYKRTIGDKTDEYVFGISTNVRESMDANFAKEQNISEAEGKTEVSGEASSAAPEARIEDSEANIVKLAVMTIDKGSDIFGDPRQTHLTSSYINLGTKCSAKDVDEKLKSLQFVPMDNKIKEKEHIVNAIANNIGYTHISRIDSANISSIDNSLKNIETRQTTSEKLISQADALTDKLIQTIKGLNLNADKVTYPFAFAGAAAKEKDFYTYPKDGKSAYYIPFSTGILDKRNEEIVFKFYPTLVDNSGKIIKPAHQTQQVSPATSQDSSTAVQDTSTAVQDSSTASQDSSTVQDSSTASQAASQSPSIPQGELGIVITIDTHGHGNNVPPYHVAKADDKEGLKKAYIEAVQDLIKLQIIEPVRNSNLGGDTSSESAAASESFIIEYGKNFNIAESFMSSFGFTGANQIRIDRTIKAPKSKFTYFALSENAWGDGSKLNPQKYLEESLDSMLNKYNTYDDFAKLAKNSRTVNLVKITEDCSYSTAMPSNRYQMLTAANPLYEGLVIVRFDSNGNLVESIKAGVKKIYHETA